MRVPSVRFLFLLSLLAFTGGYAVHALGPRDNPFPPSPMVGRKVPLFSLPPAIATVPGLGSANLSDGKPKLLNIFASWCLPCQAEARQLHQLSAMGYRIDAIATRDTAAGVARFAKRLGNPFAHIGLDAKGVVQRNLKTSGVPETFIIAGNGVILYHHVGDIRPEDVPVLIRQLGSTR